VYCTGRPFSCLRAAPERCAFDRPRIGANIPEERGISREAVLEPLLADRRITVHAEPEGDFRVEGLFELRLETTDARNPEGRRASAMVGSSGPQHACYVDDLPVRIAA
jgi:hypothetical protein